jgi:hypothetical protein
LKDLSHYDGTTQTLPPVTTYNLPSYAIFSDRHYPAAFPQHTNPSVPLPAVNRQHPLTPDQIIIANNHVNLVNSQTAGIPIDFRAIVDAIRQVRW